MPKLSILICSLESRAAQLAELLGTLSPQLTDDVELLIDVDNGEVPIGRKRNSLLNNAKGDFVCFVDDDDQVSPEYVSRILTALESEPDCVGFKLLFYVNSQNKGRAIHSLRFQAYGQKRIHGITEYERTPNHLNPIRREIAVSVGFPELNRGEDTDFAVRVRPLLETEVFVDEFLYHYLYRSRK